MSPIKTVFSLVFALLITGCASSPTQFASPDVENGTYTIGEGETLKLKKPDPRTIGFQDYNDSPNFYEIIDFKASPYTEGGDQIPDSHMIGVRAADPESGGEIVIPLQYVEKLKGSKDDWYVEHSISGVKSPLPILVLKKMDLKSTSFSGISPRKARPSIRSLFFRLIAILSAVFRKCTTET